MARMRTVKPEFWTDRHIVKMSPFARLLYIGTWNFACDAGHIIDTADELKLKVLPADDVDVDVLLDEIVSSERITRHKTATGRDYLFCPKLVEHQKIDPRWVSRCPICTELRASTPRNGSPKLTGTHVSLVEVDPSLTETPRNSPKLTENRRSTGTGTGTGTGKERERAPGKRATTLPADFTITDPMREWAIARDLGRTQTLAETERFKDWCVANGRTYKDWAAGWRTWMSRVAPDGASPRSHRIEGM